MDNVRPFRINVPSTEVEWLNQKLLNSRIPQLFEDHGEYGPSTSEIRRISKYWREEFSWRSFEARLNELPQYEATITLDDFNPLQVHFVHQRSRSANAIPLLFIHGCA